ncbi:MAG: choice-of-anchor D domain-containing protein, partial [Gemmatimonadetes bacterium]|nr:choice-of-anchor D domain-containing protein [Gemmatimonadota bacterium]
MFSGTTAFFTSVARQMPSAVVLCFLGMMRIVYAQEDARVITTVAGSGTYGFAGDGGPALEARIAAWGIAVDGNGNIYMSDPENSRVRKIDGQTGIISTSAGNGGQNFGGVDLAINRSLLQPHGLHVDGAGNLYIADRGTAVVRKVDAVTGLMRAVAGSEFGEGFDGDGGLSGEARFNGLQDVAVDGAGNLYIADTFNHRIRRVDAETDIVTTIAGNGIEGFSGDGGPGAEASLSMPQGVSVDSFGNVYVADSNNRRIRRIDGDTGVITTVAGNGFSGFSGDGGQATSAMLNGPVDVFVAGSGRGFIADFAGGEIRAAMFAGQIYISDTFNHRIRRVDEAGIITTVAGSSSSGFSGDGGQAVRARLTTPSQIAVDETGNIYMVDGDSRIRKVEGDPLARVAEGGGLEMSVDALHFGELLVGDEATKVLALTNRNNQPIQLTLTLSGSDAFGMETGEVALSPGGRMSVALVFAPLIGGEYTGELSIALEGAEDQQVTVPLTGTGSAVPRLVLRREEIRFVDVVAEDQVVEVLLIENESTFGADLALTLEGDPAFVAPRELLLPAKGSGRVLLTFAPPALGSYEGVLNIGRVGEDEVLLSVTLRGQGVEPSRIGFIGDKELVTVAGGFTGDGGPATEAFLIAPQDLDMDEKGNVYVAEGRRIRVIDSAGNITTLVEAQSTIISLEVDGMGNVFFSSGGLIHKRDQSGTVTVVAGTLTFNRDTDNVRATEAFLGGTDAPLKIAVDEAGNIYIASGRDIWCWKVEAATGLIKVLVGNAGRGDSGDGGPASEAQINLAKDVAVDRVGNVYIADHNSHRVRRVDAITGIISTVAGTGASGSGGDGGPAVSAMLNFPRSLHVDGSDDLYIIDQVGIRRVDAAGSLSNLLEMHSFGFAGDGGPASEAAFNFSAAVLADGEGEIYIADTGNDRLRKVDSAGIISTVVGGGLDDGVQATKTMLNAPNDVAVDAAGNIYIADTGNNLIRKVDATTGIITSVAGGGNASYPDYGDGGPATEAVLNSPQGIFVDGDGVLYIADTNNRKIRKVDGDGRISTVAGNPDAGVSLGDGGPAIGAKLSPTDVIVDGDGNIYIVDTFNFRIRKVDPAGTITTIAGNGDFKESGYGGAAIDAGLARPTGLFVDGAGNLFIASASGGLSKVDGTGTISKVVSDFSGLANIDGNGTGDLYVSQPFNSLASKSVMVVSQTGIVETMAQGFINPQGVFYDRQNDRLYIADAGDGRIVRLDNLDPIVLGLASMEEATAEDEEVQEATGSFQRTQLWELARVANLGPRAGNGVDATDVVVDRRRNRAFVGNIDNISVVNLQLGTVTGVIGRDAMGTFFNDERRYLGINGRRDELYVLSNGEYLQVLDLGSQLRKNQIDLGNTMRNDRSDHLRKLLVDEEGNRLYVVARQSFRGTAVGNFSAKNGLAVDLVDGRVIGEIQLNGTMDIALSPDGRVLYAANGADRQIDLVDIGTLQITGSISLQLIPQAILADPRGSYLYAVVIEEINSNAKLIRIDLRTNTVTGEIEMGDLYILPLMVIEQGTRIMWLTGGDGGAGFLPGTSHSKVDLENFRLLTGDLVTEGFFPTVLSAMTINPIDRELVMTGRQSNLTLTANLDNGAIRDQIEIGAQPVGVAVSERLNQVYIARGEHGGFFVFDGQGDLLNTVEGELIGFAGGRVIVVDDVSDRLFVNEGLAVSTYELSSLRLLNRALIAQRGEIVLPATGLRLDHDRGILWVVAADFLIELDLLTGAEISRTRFPESDRLGNMILLPDSNKAYASYHDFAANDKIKAGLLRVFDRSTRSVTKIIDIAAHIPAIFDQGRVIPELLGVDIERKRLYVWINTNNTKIAAIDIEKDEVVEVLDVEIERVDFNLLLDSVNDKIFYSSGLIFDIETGAQERFASTQSDGGLIAHNRVTNTIYVVGKEGMNIFLGPAGTETPPPPAPAEAAATPGDEEVVLTWTAVEDPALVGYHVYRSQDTGFVRITRTPLTKTSFTDIDLVNGQTYSYQVSSLGQNALESLGRTAPVAAVPTSGGNFRLLVLRKNVAVARGDSVSLPMSIESLEAFDEEVTLSAQSAEGIEVLFNPSTLAPPKIVEVVVKAAEGASLGRFEVTLGGKGGDKEQEAGLVVEVTAKVLEQSALTLELDQEETPLDIAL